MRIEEQLSFSCSKNAQLDFRTALATARQQHPPALRCQALAWVARYAPDQNQVAATSRAAAVAASEEVDEYRRTFPLAWPIRALLERSHSTVASEIMTTALQQLATVLPLVSRSEAAFVLLQSGVFGTYDLWMKPFEALLEIEDNHWRHRRNVRDAFLIAASAQRDGKKLPFDLVKDDKLRLEISSRLENHDEQRARPFFWGAK
jgi:hypothetical protein